MVLEQQWFPLDEQDLEELTELDRQFVGILASRFATRERADFSDYAFKAGDGESLVATVGVSDAAANLGLIDFGVHFFGDRVCGDRVHNQLFTLPERASPWGLAASGSVEELARESAEWFEAVLRKPIVLYVWLRNGDAYAARYAFADTGETICQTYDADLAPDGQQASLIKAGHVRGRGWIQTSGLPSPDLYLHISGDLDRATVPATIRAVTARGPISGVWYE